MSADHPFKNTRALVIDSNKALLDSTVRQLVDLGVTQVLPCRDLAKARTVLEKLAFDFVLCADELQGCGLSGQDLLESLRRDSVLSHTTVFMLLANKATYLSVMEAAEAALDCLLLRPFRASDLHDRLGSARHRRQALAPVFEALNRGELGPATELCLALQAQGGPYAQLSGRMAAELMLKTGRETEALELFRQFTQASPPPDWACLGMSRAHMALGDIAAARREVSALLERQPELPDALDVLGRALVELGELEGALDASRRALQVTPHCLLRLQQGGSLAFYQNEPELALQLLERARGLDPSSRLFDAMTLMLLAALHADRRDRDSLGALHDSLRQYHERFAQSSRLRRMAVGSAALLALVQDKPDEALALVRQIAAERGAPDFDLESANLLLMLWVRMPERAVGAGEQQQVIGELARRFCVSRAATAALLASARQGDTVCALIREAQAGIGQIAEAALRLAMQGEPGGAVSQLLQHGGTLGNARLIALAGQLLKRHHRQLPQAEGMRQRAAELEALHCRPATYIAGMRRTGRAAGGLMVRMKPSAQTAEVAPLVPRDEVPRAA